MYNSLNNYLTKVKKNDIIIQTVFEPLLYERTDE